jgi:hypothetical protein
VNRYDIALGKKPVFNEQFTELSMRSMPADELAVFKEKIKENLSKYIGETNSPVTRQRIIEELNSPAIRQLITQLIIG